MEKSMVKGMMIDSLAMVVLAVAAFHYSPEIYSQPYAGIID